MSLQWREQIVDKIEPQLRKIAMKLIEESIGSEGEQEVKEHVGQFRKLFRKLNTVKKAKILDDKVHRRMLIKIIMMDGIDYYSYSYFNRAKLTEDYIHFLQEVGPFLFTEAIMISSKLHVINTNYARIFTEDHLYDEEETPIDVKIKEIMKLCDKKQKKKNNNLRKLQALLSDRDLRIELIKELGKMLRGSWKKEKSSNAKNKHTSMKEEEMLENMNECLENWSLSSYLAVKTPLEQAKPASHFDNQELKSLSLESLKVKIPDPNLEFDSNPISSQFLNEI